MRAIADQDQLRRNLLLQAQEDHLGLWWVAEEVAKHLHDPTESSVRAITLSLVADLLRSGLWQAGYPAPNGSDFEAWTVSPGEILARIEGEWRLLERQPTIGEIVWFTTTEAGDRAARMLRSAKSSSADESKPLR